MRIGAIVFTGLGFVAALVAAHYWCKASRVDISHTDTSLSDVPEMHILNIQVAYNESARLNSIAAKWTAGAAVLSSIGAILGVV